MRNLLAVSLFVLGIFFSVTTIPNVGVPPKIAVLLPTPESVSLQIKQEKLQKLYDAAARIAMRVYHSHRCAGDAATVGQLAVDFNISPRIIAAVEIAESSCNPVAISPTKDVGRMQVNAKVWHFSVEQLLDSKFNYFVGTRILATYIHQFGLIEGLHHYNGLGNPTNAYAQHVLQVAGIST